MTRNHLGSKRCIVTTSEHTLNVEPCAQVDRRAQFGLNTETRKSVMSPSHAARPDGDSARSAQLASTGMMWHVRLLPYKFSP